MHEAADVDQSDDHAAENHRAKTNAGQQDRRGQQNAQGRQGQVPVQFTHDNLRGKGEKYVHKIRVTHVTNVISCLRCYLLVQRTSSCRKRHA